MSIFSKIFITLIPAIAGLMFGYLAGRHRDVVPENSTRFAHGISNSIDGISSTHHKERSPTRNEKKAPPKPAAFAGTPQEMAMHLGKQLRSIDQDADNLFSLSRSELKEAFENMSPDQLFGLIEHLNVGDVSGISKSHQSSLRRAAFQQLAAVDPAGAIGMLEKTPPDHIDPASGEPAHMIAGVSGLFEAWTRLDPSAARAALGNLRSDFAAQARASFYLTLANNAPGAALGELVKNNDLALGGQVLSRWAAQDPEAASKAALSWVKDAETSQMVVEALVEHAPTANSREAMAWTSALPEVARHTAEVALLSRMALTAPSEAADMLAQLVATDPKNANGQEGNILNIARGLLESSSGEKALGWVSMLPEGPAKESALKTVAAQWTSKDPEAASRWIASIDNSTQRTTAATGLVEEISYNDPQSALAWAKSLGASPEKTSALGKVFTSWLSADPDAAYQELLTVPEQDRAAIIESIKEARH